jgi:hypothetical protein
MSFIIFNIFSNSRCLPNDNNSSVELSEAPSPAATSSMFIAAPTGTAIIHIYQHSNYLTPKTEQATATILA